PGLPPTVGKGCSNECTIAGFLREAAIPSGSPCSRRHYPAGPAESQPRARLLCPTEKLKRWSAVRKMGGQRHGKGELTDEGRALAVVAVANPLRPDYEVRSAGPVSPLRRVGQRGEIDGQISFQLLAAQFLRDAFVLDADFTAAN